MLLAVLFQQITKRICIVSSMYAILSVWVMRICKYVSSVHTYVSESVVCLKEHSGISGVNNLDMSPKKLALQQKTVKLIEDQIESVKQMVGLNCRLSAADLLSVAVSAACCLLLLFVCCLCLRWTLDLSVWICC